MCGKFSLYELNISKYVVYIIYFIIMQTLFFRMSHKVQNKNDFSLLTPAEKLFVCNLNVAKGKYPMNSKVFSEKFVKFVLPS